MESKHFNKFKGAFPPHCIAGTKGSEFHKDLNISESDFIVQKGKDPLVEQFSGFGNPDLLQILKSLGAQEVYVVGLAYDFCVGSTAVDSKANGFETFVVKNLSRGISDETMSEMEKKFKEVGINVIEIALS
jgi:nicotinamidase/pyrazinamidase